MANTSPCVCGNSQYSVKYNIPTTPRMVCFQCLVEYVQSIRGCPCWCHGNDYRDLSRQCEHCESTGYRKQRVEMSTWQLMPKTLFDTRAWREKKMRINRYGDALEPNI